MSFGQRELPIIGNWPATSRMPERHGRGVRPNELLLRNAIAHKFASGWEHAPAYHIPTTVDGHVLAGKEPENLETATKTDTDRPPAEDTHPEAEGEPTLIVAEPAQGEEENESAT